jgi:hypothetical protein
MDGFLKRRLRKLLVSGALLARFLGGCDSSTKRIG